MSNPKQNKGKGRGILILAIAAAVAAALAGTGWHFAGRRAGQTEAKKTIYTCVMHHQIRRDKPGDCPICGMTLVPLEQVLGSVGATPTEGSAAVSAPRRVKYWVNPMNPAQRSDKPMKDGMGMDYTPVYEEETAPSGSGAPPEIQGLAPVRLSPYKEQLIGVKFTTVEQAPITDTIHTTGRFGGGEGGFANLAADFAAGSALRSSGRYVVADVYALDIPFVKVGQRAWVSPLSGGGPKVEGRVAQVYPYDATQSRILRVRINLSKPLSGEIFANVEIEAVTDSRTAVPPTAVMDTGARQYVYVATGAGILTPKPVTVGFHGDDLWEITSGLEPGEKVVDGANFMIDADSKINAGQQ